MLVTLPFCWMAPFGSLHGWYSPPTSGRSTSIPALKSRLTQAREKSHASSHRFARCWRLHKSHSARGKSTWGQTGDTSGIFQQAARRSYRWCSPPTSWRGYSRDSRLDCLQLVIALAIASGDTRWLSSGLRSDEGQYGRLHHPAGIPQAYRRYLWQGATGLGNGSGDSNRGGLTRDASARTTPSIWWAPPKPESSNMRRSGWICLGRKCATRWK